MRLGPDVLRHTHLGSHELSHILSNYALQHWLYGRLSLGIEHIQESRFHAFDGNG